MEGGWWNEYREAGGECRAGEAGKWGQEQRQGTDIYIKRNKRRREGEEGLTGSPSVERVCTA